MTRIGIAITKSTSFRGGTQEFSNVYYYDGLLGRPSVAQAEALIDEATTREKTWHSTAVTFLRGRCWEQTGDKATTEMIATKSLSGTGSMGLVNSFDKERSYLFRLRAGVDTRGNPVYLRKWYHGCGLFDGTISINSTTLDNTTGFSAADRTALRNKMNSIGSIGSGPTLGTLCAKGGRQPDAGATWEAHQYLEHHQLGDMWRAK
jgi:hypothetical protein